MTISRTEKFALGRPYTWLAVAGLGIAIVGLLLHGLARLNGAPPAVAFQTVGLLVAGLTLTVTGGWLSYRRRGRRLPGNGREDPAARILESGPIPIAVHRDGEILYVNPAAVEFLGAPNRESLLRTSLLDLVPVEDRPFVLERLEQIRSGEDVEAREFRVVRLDGQIRYAQAKGIRIDYRGAPAILTSARDVTGERQAQKALRSSERRYREVFQQSVAGIYRVTPDGQVLEANDAFARMLGFRDGAALQGSDLFDFFRSPGDRAPRLQELREAGSLTNREVELRRADGQPVWLLENLGFVEDPETGATVIVGTAVDITDRKRAELALRNSEQRYRRLFQDSQDAIYITGLDGTIIAMNPAGLKLFGYTEAELNGLHAQDLYVDPGRRQDFHDAIVEFGYVEDFEVQLRRKDGEVLDCLLSATVRRDGREEIVGYQGIIRDVTERKKFEQQLERRALHDPLTDLPNRALFWDRLQHAMRRAQRQDEALAVLFIDLDRFKVVNDSLGHMAGDRVLTRVAARLLGCVRAQDTVARFGGDEFTVLLEGVAGEEEAVEVAERILQAFNAPFRVEDEEIHLRASIGLSLYDAGRARDADAEPRPDDLVRRADLAMFRAKTPAGTGYRLFDPAVDVEETGRLQQENELRRAIEGGELILHYHPIVDLRRGWIVGVEPLVRWQHPERGLVPPDEFIPLAEETGLVMPLGAWVIETACRDLVAWTEALGLERPLFLHPNISARQFEDPDLPRAILKILLEAELEPERLRLEVTERMVMMVPERLRALKKLGVGIAVDDFGTGYSSLGYVRELAVDALKIDRTFVNGLADASADEAIVRTIITLGQTLKLDVVAEGIERLEQLERLRALGCDFGQGHYFAPTLSNGEFKELLARDPRW